MEINCYRVKNLSYIVVEEFFTPVELKNVLQEVKDLKRFLLPPDKTSSDTRSNGESKKTGLGVFLDLLYQNNRAASPILQANRKLFSEEILRPAEEFDSIFKFLGNSNIDSTLLNCYTEHQEYKPHKDNSRISAVTFIDEGDFSGGQFAFPEQDVVIEAKHNRAVLFPSCVIHQALPVEGNGVRVSIAQFIDRQDV